MRFVKQNLSRLAIIALVLVAWLVARSAQAGPLGIFGNRQSSSACANGQCAMAQGSVAQESSHVTVCGYVSKDADGKEWLKSYDKLYVLVGFKGQYLPSPVCLIGDVADTKPIPTFTVVEKSQPSMARASVAAPQACGDSESACGSAPEKTYRFPRLHPRKK